MTSNGSVIAENIYLNEGALEVTFVKKDGSGEVSCSSCGLFIIFIAAFCSYSQLHLAALQFGDC